MNTLKFQFSQKQTSYCFNAQFRELEKLASPANAIVVTDKNVFEANRQKFRGWKTIVIKAGEKYKVQKTVDEVILKMIRYGADRKTILVGVGGGVVTDIAGYAASVYMRGIRFGFAPSSILAMVDASIGGKNGVDVGVYKNLAGTIRQPDFLLYDSSFLKSLPPAEWVNGFAEIIKHACIKDAGLFRELESRTIAYYKKDRTALDALIRKNAVIKSKVVTADEFEKGERRLLNFGHTWGHAIETKYRLPHGHAVSIGMVMACRISEKLTGFRDTARVIRVLERYGLPVQLEVNNTAAFNVLKMDKKRENASMNYVLLNRIGKSTVYPIAMQDLEILIRSI